MRWPVAGFKERLPAAVGLCLLLADSNPLLACSVCFGDPDSPIAKGAVAGVVVLVGIVGFVLTCIAGTGLFWLHRSRVLARHADSIPTDSES